MDNNDVNGLRSELFETIRALRDKANPMDVERAKAVAVVAGAIIESAKVEVQMINALGRNKVVPTGFIGHQPGDTLDSQARLIGTTTVPKPGRGLPPPGPTGRV